MPGGDCRQLLTLQLATSTDSRDGAGMAVGLQKPRWVTSVSPSHLPSSCIQDVSAMSQQSVTPYGRLLWHLFAVIKCIMVFLSSSDRGPLVQSTALSTTRDGFCFKATRTLFFTNPCGLLSHGDCPSRGDAQGEFHPCEKSPLIV